MNGRPECEVVQLLCKRAQWFLKKLKIEPACDPAIPLLDMHPKELKSGSWRDRLLHTHFYAAFFTVAKMQKQPKGLQAGGWINKLWSILTRK